MKTTFQIPRVLQKLCNGKMAINVAGETVWDVLDEVKRQYPPLYGCICDETGKVRRHLNLFLNDELLACPQGLETPVETGDVIAVFQAVSGG